MKKGVWIEYQLCVGDDYIEKLPDAKIYNFDLYLANNKTILFFKDRAALVRLKEMLDDFLERIKK